MLTQQQLATALGVTDRTIRRWSGDGMPGVGSGRRRVYDLAEARAWVTRAGKDGLINPPQPFEEDPPRRGPPAPAAPSPPAPDAPDEPEARAPTPSETTKRRVAPGDERANALSSRRRAWDVVELGIHDLGEQLEGGKLRVTPGGVKQMADVARALTDSVRGDPEGGAPTSPRELLTAAVAAWIRQWGEEGLSVLLADARLLEQRDREEAPDGQARSA